MVETDEEVFFFETVSGLIQHEVHRHYTGIIQAPNTEAKLRKKRKQVTPETSTDRDPPPSTSSLHRRSGERREEERPLGHLHKTIGNHCSVDVVARFACHTQQDIVDGERASTGDTPRLEQVVEPE